MTRFTPDAKPAIIANMGDKEALAKFLRREDWNQIHLIIRGNVLTHLINGQVMSIVVDEDSTGRPASGLIGVQVHVGPPMKIEYRNFFLKALPGVANKPSAGTP